jgi:dTMP kinase
MTPLCRKIVAMPLITFEGSEGCGKSTQVKRPARLEKWGLRPAVLREPGGTAIGEGIQHLLQHSEDNHATTPETELLLSEVSHSQLVREKIQPALRRGEWVIRDRMEEESDEFHERVIRAYRELAENEPRRVILIDGRISPDTIENQIWNTFAQRFPDLGKQQTPKTKRLQTP